MNQTLRTVNFKKEEKDENVKISLHHSAPGTYDILIYREYHKESKKLSKTSNTFTASIRENAQRKFDNLIQYYLKKDFQIC